MNKPVSPTERLSIEAVLRMGSSRAGGVKLWYLVVAGFIALPLVLWLVVGSTATSTKYLTDPATRGALTVVVTATGSVQPTNQVDVSSELSGIVRNVLVDYNSPVKVGQVLAELDTDKLKATVDSSRAKLDAAKAKVAEAEATVIEKELDYNRKASLVEKHITSTLDFEVARALFRRALAVRESARADVAVAEADLNAQRDQPRQGRHTVAHQWRRAEAQCRPRPDGGVLLSGAGPVHHRRGSDTDGGPGRRR